GAYEETGLTRLCMAGGVALNSVANGRIIRETPFEELYVHPAAGDGGAAVGAALYGYHTILGKARGFVMDHATWGEAHGPDATERFLREGGIRYERIEDEDRLLAAVRGRPPAGHAVRRGRRRVGRGPGGKGEGGGGAVVGCGATRGGPK